MNRDRPGGPDHPIVDNPFFEQHEFEVDGHYSPCREWIWDERAFCLNTTRCIRFVPANSGKKLVCGRGHNQLHNGKVFIPAFEFGEGGEFADILPLELRPTEGKIKLTRWKVSSTAADRLEAEHSCALCEAPPFNAFKGQDATAAWAWINEHDLSLLAHIHAELQTKAGFELSAWFSVISVDLRKKIVDRFTMSTLVVDHGIPRKIGNSAWSGLSRAEQSFVQNLLFKLCRKCNATKSAKLIPLRALSQMYANTYYGGELAVAINDKPRWQLFTSVTEKIYAQQVG